MLVYIFLYEDNFQFIKILESTTYFVYAISYLLTALINPGIPNKKHFSKNYTFTNKEEIKQYQICKKCNIIFLKIIALLVMFVLKIMIIIVLGLENVLGNII